jgi:hypothetical protein
VSPAEVQEEEFARLLVYANVELAGQDHIVLFMLHLIQ